MDPEFLTAILEDSIDDLSEIILDPSITMSSVNLGLSRAAEIGNLRAVSFLLNWADDYGTALACATPEAKDLIQSRQ